MHQGNELIYTQYPELNNKFDKLKDDLGGSKKGYLQMALHIC